MYYCQVYIHGGGFMYGEGGMAGPNRFMRHDVVLITLNYRLGVLGYLSTGDKDLAGNWGALDQIAALDWVQKHVASFGGNPRRVTIFGHTAGAASVHLLTLSKRSAGKFEFQNGQASPLTLPPFWFSMTSIF
jgi:carboxylesterase type B